MKKLLLMLLPILLLSGCAEDTVEITPSSSLAVAQSADVDSAPSKEKHSEHFYDEAVKKAVESYFEKSESELTEEDFDTLSTLHYFIIKDPVESLKDIPTVFPALNGLCVSYDKAVPAADCDILSEMKKLKAVKIYSPGLPSLEFARKLSYVDILYREEAYQSNANNLAAASVLEKDFISGQLAGHVKNYVRIVENERIYELFTTDHALESDDEFLDPCYESKVFISQLINSKPVLQTTVDVVDRIGNAEGGLHVVDVDFDGNEDILVENGQFGSQGMVFYSCFLNRNGLYESCSSFSEIPNATIDKDNKKVLGAWRNSAASHSWAMYEYVAGKFVMTDCLTEEPAQDEEGEIEVWTYTAEKKAASGEIIESKFYSEKEYAKEQLETLFFSEDSYWSLLSDKWTIPEKWLIF